MPLQTDAGTPVLENNNVDNYAGSTGVIDTFASLSFDMPDNEIIRNLDSRINDSHTYWNSSKGFDLEKQRNANTKLYLGKIDETGLYKHQRAYNENQTFVALESIVAYVTSQIAGPIVLTNSREEQDKLFASDFEKAIKAFFASDENNLEQLVELWVRDIQKKRIAVGHFLYNKDIGDIELKHVDPATIVLDKNTPKGGNPGFVSHTLKRTVEELINEFPDKEKEILGRLGVKRKGAKNMTQEISVRKVWVTHYDKNNEPQEGLVWYYENIVLSKIRNPNYLYTKKHLNLFKYPKKPYIFGNLINDGTHLIDDTTPLEQAAEMQRYLNRRGRQIGENADKANGLLVISTRSGLTKDDGENITGDPNQKLFLDDEDGSGVDKLVTQLNAQVLPQYVMADKLDARAQVGNIMGAPSDFTGSQADDGDPTLGEVMIKKNQAAGRQDLMVRSITRMVQQVYQYFAQMAIVWYDDEHTFTYDAGDGDIDIITLKRDVIPKGLTVKASKPANPDRSRIEAIALQLLKEKAISLLDAYKILQLDNAQQLYDNWAKQQADPTSLARDAMDVIDEAEAHVAYNDIMAGKDVPDKLNPSKDYILSLRKLMINDDFLHAKKSDQNRFIKYVTKALDSLEERMQLEQISEQSENGEALRPSNQLPDPNAPQMPPQTPPMGQSPNGMPLQGPPGTQPPLPPMPPGMPMAGQAMPGQPMPQPPMGGGQPMPMPPSGPMAGTPIPAPGQAPQPNPGNPSSLPMA